MSQVASTPLSEYRIEEESSASELVDGVDLATERGAGYGQCDQTGRNHGYLVERGAVRMTALLGSLIEHFVVLPDEGRAKASCSLRVTSCACVPYAEAHYLPQESPWPTSHQATRLPRAAPPSYRPIPTPQRPSAPAHAGRCRGAPRRAHRRQEQGGPRTCRVRRQRPDRRAGRRAGRRHDRRAPRP